MFVKNLTNDILTVRKSGKVLKLKPGVNCVDGFWSAEFLKSVYGPQYIICYNEEAKEEVAEVEVKEEKTEEVKAETEEKAEVKEEKAEVKEEKAKDTKVEVAEVKEEKTEAKKEEAKEKKATKNTAKNTTKNK